MPRYFQRPIAAVLVSAIVWQILWPAGTLLALTSGPTQPEFSTFEPVGTSGMVNPLTGQFTYNLPVVSIPGPNGSGYALSLSYHSGTSPEEDASWVGYGWTLNAGAVNRVKRGFPDDYNGDTVRYWNRTVPNWTATAGISGGLEAYSNVAISPSARFRYNNYKGFSVAAGLATSVFGTAQLGLNVDPDGLSFSYDISPAGLMSELGLDFQTFDNPDFIASALRSTLDGGLRSLFATPMRYAQYATSNETRATSFTPFIGTTSHVNAKIFHGDIHCLDIGTYYGLDGSFSIQKPDNEGINALEAFGYMYSANAGGEDMMDYYVENDAPYSKRDRFLGAPFSNADYFNVTGEGVGGGFRLYNKKPGQFHPNATHSHIGIVHLGVEPHIGTQDYGILAWFGAGLQTLDIGDWNDANTTYSFASDADGDEPYFFRMNNDRGGSLTFADNDNAVGASIGDENNIWGIEKHNPHIDPDQVKALNGGARSKRSAYIGYTTIDEVLKGPSIAAGFVYPNYQAYGTPDLGGLSSPQTSSRVAEFSMTTPTGLQYVYGQPVYGRKEKNLQYGLSQLSPRAVVDNRLAYANVTAPKAPVVIGEERDALYATSYLLTNIATPDYVDRTKNGPSMDDYGGITRFSYVQTAGDRIAYGQMNVDPTQVQAGQQVVSRPTRTARLVTDSDKWADPTVDDASSWYKWRVPYKGLRVERNKLSDPDDDMGSMAMGEREIYYLGTIDTKSHVAVFVTNAGIYTHGRLFRGSGEHRMDGYEALHNEYKISGITTADRTRNPQGPDSNQLRRLERIELWSKDANGALQELVQTVHFEYDYLLCQHLPNSSFTGQNQRVGKLTLRRVYFEHNGVKNAAINPYVFGYEYRTVDGDGYDALPGDVLAKYETDLREVDNLSSAEQNPTYSDHMIDRWGSYQFDGQSRWTQMKPWVDQTPDASQFDPAAWQLKWIRLPSGGEIRVQYEQNDYSYVQDRSAMAMVPLCSLDIGANKYYLDVDELLGPGAAPEQVNALVEAMHDLYITNGEKAYFKFLISLDGTPASIADIDKGRAEYVTGYAPVTDIGRVPAGQNCGGKISFKFGQGSFSNPVHVAMNYARTQRNGIVGKAGLQQDDDPQSTVHGLMGHTNDQLFDAGQFTNGTIIDWDNSYLRIPLGMQDKIVAAKKGGGIRVKRLLMYDPGLQDGAGHLFGSEYLYKTEQGYSSGVAANEPEVGGEESALVRLLDKRADQSWLEKAISGKDREQFEGPIGSSLLPGPVVNYSRIIVKNIHDGKTNPGFTIHEYFTTRDYPSQCIYGPRDVNDENVTALDPETDFMAIPSPYFVYNRSNIWVTQGYRFILNDMNGQMKKMAVYGGDYADPSTWVASSSRAYEYFAPGEEVPMLYDYTTNPTWRYEDPGKEMEVTSEGRAIEDVSVDASMRAVAGVILCTPVPLPLAAFSGTISYSESKLRRHVTCKVVRYPAIIKKTTSSKDGIFNVVENIGFSPLTGEPIVARTTDGYKGLPLQLANGANVSPPETHNRSYKAFTYPAAQEYAAMGQKAGNERADIRTEEGRVEIDKLYDAGRHYLSFRFPGVNTVCTAGDLLTAGDLVNIYYVRDGEYDPGSSVGMYHIRSISGNRVILEPHSGMLPTYFAAGISIRIVRSGRTNQLLLPRASIVTYTPD